ncbi:hypothetical protein T440DRAFT_543713 [Plenodomus tracheiphilus IPT5]|uniref:Fungal N-terminal domain-containing protein n=1 Tax=Plenodomus tracheiphilus IPT5 TaxID=1408161 RepID=A0A6A7AS91_9PLEO|nr:hypothetical protein T440DRAFT_543713 [Plenodomus tracheiphilus IPT5]
MEVFGVVAGGIAISTTLIRLGEGTHKAIKHVQHARGDITQLADEAIMFAGLYEAFRSACDDDLKKSMDTSLATRRLNSFTHSLIKDLSQIYEKVEILTLDQGVKRSVTKVARAHFEWFFKRNDVERLRASLSIARENINGFLIIVAIRKLNQLLEFLTNGVYDQAKRIQLQQKFGMPLGDKIKSLKQEILNKNKVYKATKRVADTAKQMLATTEKNPTRNSPFTQSDEVFTFAESIEECARSVLSDSAGRKRTRSKTSSSSSITTSSNTRSKHYPSPAARNLEIYQSAARSPESRANIHPTREPTVEQRVRSGSVQPTRDPPSRLQGAQPLSLFNKDPPAPAFRPLTERIGRHTISIFSGGVKFNNYQFQITEEYALAFYLTLRENDDKLDDLDDALNTRQGHETQWQGIPGWLITLRGWARSGDQPLATEV